MLAISRKHGESIVIICPNGEKITIIIKKQSHSINKVLLDLPHLNYKVDRAEIHEEYQIKRMLKEQDAYMSKMQDKVSIDDHTASELSSVQLSAAQGTTR